jgi:chromosomal replication initiator protein
VAILIEQGRRRRASSCPRKWPSSSPKRIRSNVRELEGALRARRGQRALHRPADHARLRARKRSRTCSRCRTRLVTVENIQKTVADYYKVTRRRPAVSKRRSRSIARPRQVAMCARQGTDARTACPRSAMPSAGAHHTTVMHACKRIRDLRDIGASACARMYSNLLRTLTG